MGLRTAFHRIWAVALAPLITIGCSAGTDEEMGVTEEAAGPSYEIVGAGYEPLRSAFEADSGKVRAILLGSPT